MQDISYPESLMLLALDDEKGVIVPSVGMAMEYAMAGAVLFELHRQGLVTFDGDDVVKWPESPVKDPLFEATVARFLKTNKVKSVKHWICAIAHDYTKIKKVVIERLIEKGALERKDGKILWIFPQTKYPTDDSRIENRIRKELHDQVLNISKLNESGYILLSLIGAAKLENEVFSPEVVPEAQRVIRNLMKGGVGEVISQVVKEIQAAVSISITTAVMTSTIAATI